MQVLTVFGMQARLMTDPATSLPSELWARIFGLLQPTPKLLQFQVCQVGFACQSSFRQLPLVCRGFQSTFKNHPDCCNHILLKESMLDEAESGASVLAWLWVHSMVLKSVKAYALEPSIIARWLSALSGPDPALELAWLGIVSQADVNSLAGFKALTTCWLAGGRGEIDLAPLQTLDKLVSLKLESGHFTSVNAAGHLTSLECVRHTLVMSSSDCRSCTSLVNLEVGSGSSVSLHTRGVCACTALQRVQLGYCSRICAADRSNLLSTLAHVGETTAPLPANVSCLTVLTHLSLSVHPPWCDYASQANFSEVSLLASLESLYVEVMGSFKVDQAFGALTKLTYLSICTTSVDKGCADLSVDWTSLKALQSLHVHAPFTCGVSVLGLAELEHLKIADFSHSKAVDTCSKDLLVALENAFAAKKLSALMAPQGLG